MPARRLGRNLMRIGSGSRAARQQGWVVLLEAAPGDGGETSPMDVETARALLRAMGDDDGFALECPDRVALQVRVMAPDPLIALWMAMTRWRAAKTAVGHEGWNLVRTEVLTFREFERDVEVGLS